MTHPEWIFWIGTVIVCLSAITAWLFVIYYGRYTRFEETDVGRHQMATMGMFAVVLTWTAWRSVNIDVLNLAVYPVTAAYIRIVIYGVLEYVILGWLLLLVREQRKARRQADVD
jgi:hypothetical protein